MKLARKLLVVFLALIVAGLAKHPFEKGFTDNLRERRLLVKPIDLDTRKALGQTSYAIALGGMRSLIASTKNLKAHAHFEHQEWGKLEDEFQTITTLQPHTRYYWDVASWHLAYNAYADFGDRPNIPDARRRFLQKDYLARGIRFLEDGIDSNPDDWRLRQALVRILTDPFKPNDLPKAVAALEDAITIADSPQILHRELLYALARMPNRNEDAWRVAREVWSNPNNRDVPSVRLIYVALEFKNVAPADRTLLEEIFGPRGGYDPKFRVQNRLQALKYLSFYWLRKREGFVMDGVRETIELLLKEFKVPVEASPLNGGKGWSGYPSELFRLHQDPLLPEE